MDAAVSRTADGILCASFSLAVLARLLYPGADGTHDLTSFHVVCIIGCPLACTIWAVMRLRVVAARISERLDEATGEDVPAGNVWLRISQSSSAPLLRSILVVASYPAYVIGCYLAFLLLTFGIMFEAPPQFWVVILTLAASTMVALVAFVVGAHVVPRIGSRRYQPRRPGRGAGSRAG